MQVGIAVVGMSSLLAGHGGSQVVSSSEMLTGMALIVASQVPSHEQLLLLLLTLFEVSRFLLKAHLHCNPVRPLCIGKSLHV